VERKMVFRGREKWCLGGEKNGVGGNMKNNLRLTRGRDIIFIPL